MVTSISCIVFNQKNVLHFIKDMQSRGLIASISVGVKEEEYAFIEQLAAEQLIT